ncbi:putative cytochrome p450 monooxygenase [Rosellinia necatrix]|uniref:Putative cytochrome p450 monooxygenase n=1 Tax=Rosellinia necatrix TaxID=77044 RepID=A0A1W2TK96_ROSNE|nr:putative cytochrome p450 monooxygenase [Rosellinia necatrix]
MALLDHLAQYVDGQHTLWSLARRSLLVLVAIALVQKCLTIVYNLYFHPLSSVPGPRLWIAFPILKKLRMVLGDAEFVTRDLHAKYGEVMRVSPNEVFFLNPQAWKDIYGHGHAEFPKFYPEGANMHPKKIISSNAQDHFRLRRAMLPAFSDKALTRQEPLIRTYVDLLIRRLREVSGTPGGTNMVRWYNFTTFDLIADLAFGESLHGLESGQSNVWLDNVSKILIIAPVFVLISASRIIGSIFMLFFGPLMNKAAKSHMASVENIARTRLTARKQPDRGDFMDFFLRSRGQAHELTDEEVIVNADLIMVAGSETTATLLSGTTYWLLKTPRALQRAIREVRGAFDSDDEMTFLETRARLPYLQACLEEGLRLFPPVPLALSRSVPGDVPMPVCGIMMPPKTVVGVHHLSAYSSELNFHRAAEFLPERWLPEATTNPASAFYNDRREVHRPFSFGPRDCIGRNLAYHEMRLIMAKVLFNFDLELDPSCDQWYNQRIYALWEKPPLQVHLTERTDNRTAVADSVEMAESN